MDFKTLVTKENFKSILNFHLKRQIHAKFSNAISKDFQALTDNEIDSPDCVVSSITSNIAQSDKFKEFSISFLDDIDQLFNDKGNYVAKDDNQGTISQCSSTSSVNTSIDYISYDQFQETIRLLSNGVNAEKLEALETFSRLPMLEPIIKQTLWSSIETGLHEALLSNVNFLKEASLKVYTKMLSSSEPKVVQESFSSLIKHVVTNLLPSMNLEGAELINKCKSVVEIIAVLNKFLQNIPNHWLRYPQHVIENITTQSVSILSNSSQVFPVWLCVALCDKKSKWLSNLLHGHISRACLISALQKDPKTIQLALQICDDFIARHSSLSWSSCCENCAEVAEITHVICFLAHLLSYSQGRQLFVCFYDDEPYPWLNCFDLVLKCTMELCSASCLSCCKVACKVLSKMVYYLWLCENNLQHSDLLVKMLLNFDDFGSLSTNSLWLIVECFCNIPSDFLSSIYLSETGNIVLEFISNLFTKLSNTTFDVPGVLVKTPFLLNASLILLQKILSEPSNLFFYSNFSVIFSSFINKYADLTKITSSHFAENIKNLHFLKIEKELKQLFISMLQKPYFLSELQKNELLESTFNLLLEKILDDIKSKNCVCSKDISILSSALNFTLLTKLILTKSLIFKISSVLWQFDSNDLENLHKVKYVLEILVPSIFPNVLEAEILLDENVDGAVRLFQHVLLFPSLTNHEFLMQEEYILLALQIVSELTYSVFLVCHLEANHKLSALLFEMQNDVEENAYIIDALSMVRNHILVKLNTVGGDKERILPPETSLPASADYIWPFVTSYPVPEVYYPKNSEENTSLIENLTNDLIDEKMKDIFIKYLEEDSVPLGLAFHFLNHSIAVVQSTLGLSKILNFLDYNTVENIVLSQDIVVGLQLARKYGEILHLMSEEDEETLKKLLIASKCLLGTENTLEIDLFVCTIALIFKCDAQATWNFLEVFAKSSASLFIWYDHLLHASEQNTKYATAFNIIMEYCDIIVKQTLPSIYSAFQFSNMLPSVLFQYWIRHCFWCYLNFTEIAHYVLTVVLLGDDFAIYFFVSLLKHEQNFILKNAHYCNIVTLLKTNTINGYKLKNYVSFMIQLSHTYQSQILKSVSDIMCEESSN